MKSYKVSSLILLGILFFTGCISSANLQTAKPLGKGQSQTTMGLALVYDSDVHKGDFGFFPVLPSYGASFNWGIGRRWDVGLNTCIPPYAYFSPRVKYNFYEGPRQRMYLSTGLIFTASSVNRNLFERSLSLPIYASFGDHSKCAFYLHYRVGANLQDPSFFKRYHSTENYENYDQEFNLLVHSGGFGWHFGKPTPHIYLEASYYTYNVYKIATDKALGHFRTYRQFTPRYNCQLSLYFALKSRKKKEKVRE